MCPNETEDSQSMPIWMFAAASRRPGMSSDAEVEDVIAFLVDDGFGEPKTRDLAADHAAGLRVLIEHHAVIAERREITRNRERGGAAAHERDAPAVLRDGRLRQAITDVVLEIGRNPLETADRNRFLLNAPAPAGRFARPVAGAPENPGEHVGFPIDHVGVAVATSGDQPDVFGNRRVCRTGPLAVYDLVEIVRSRDVGGFHLLLCTHACPRVPREPCANERRPASSVVRLVRAESGRIVVETSPKFHRYLRHDKRAQLSGFWSQLLAQSS
jgi:hypothetical protein